MGTDEELIAELVAENAHLRNCLNDRLFEAETILTSLIDLFSRVPAGTWNVHNPRDVCRPERREIWSTDDAGNEERVCNIPDAGHDVAQLIVTMHNELPKMFGFTDLEIQDN